ncbi:hypothetical protein [Streptomyces violaceusniger]|uniref:Uncharacterized protein n=1 Tax=Streptomyces violaceusniger (strain Tu 4113) TaxID=653045 RepID=G2PHP5_STRV4|nr:hypothetical protein [Streptomyces violaceusniger]AEM88846.1 hypothetical protein Strvi_0070 [Streptomyces violaceusniger Tu 4113]
MSDVFANFPAPYLGGPLTGKTEGAAGKRNADGAARAFDNFRAYGYIPATAPAVGSVIVVDEETKTVKADADGRAYVDVLSRKGETIAGWFGYPGSEHLTVAYCVICKQYATVYNSHVRRGSSHAGCTARGRAARVAAVEIMTGEKITAPGPQEQPNGATRAPEAPEATEATESAATVRAQAAEKSADSRPAPAPATQPPKPAAVRPLGSNQWRALDGMLNTSPRFAGLAAGEWDSARPGWQLATLSGTERVMESLTRSGHVAKTGTRYTITGKGRAEHAADPRTKSTDDGPQEGAARADLVTAPKPSAPRTAAKGAPAEPTGMDMS